MRVVATGDALFSGGNLAERLDPKLLSILEESDATFSNAEFICPAYGTAPAPRRFMTAVGIEAVDELTRIILAGQKAVPGCARVRIVGNPEVVIVSQRRVKP